MYKLLSFIGRRRQLIWANPNRSIANMPPSAGNVNHKGGPKRTAHPGCAARPGANGYEPGSNEDTVWAIAHAISTSIAFNRAAQRTIIPSREMARTTRHSDPEGQCGCRSRISIPRDGSHLPRVAQRTRGCLSRETLPIPEGSKRQMRRCDPRVNALHTTHSPGAARPGANCSRPLGGRMWQIPS
jgi:hypothetical protein